MASKRTICIKLCLLLHIFEVLLGIVLTVFSFLLQKAASVGLAETPSWLGIPLALFGLVGIIVIVLNKLKEELVFVLVFHGLVVVICLIGLILVVPKVSRWNPVSGYQNSGLCKQLSSHCNCTKNLPVKVYTCEDLTGIHELALIIAVVVGLSFGDAILAAFFDFYIINNYLPKDSPRKPVSQSRRQELDEEQLVDNLDPVGHIGPLNTPDLLPKFDDDIQSRVNSMEWNRSEVDLPLQEDYPVGLRHSIGSAASLPADHAVIASRFSNKGRSSSMPNSVTASKQSIRSRKDNLLRRLQSVQSYDMDQEQRQNEDDQDEAILNAIETNSRSSSKQQLRGSRKGTPVNHVKSTPTLPMSPKHSPETELVQETVKSPRAQSEKSNSQTSLNRSRRTVSNQSKESVKDAEIAPEVNIVQENGFEKSEDRQSPKNEDDENATHQIAKTSVSRNASRRSGFANRELYGLPPLPLKGIKNDLSVQERTFSAPSLPFIDSGHDQTSSMVTSQRPGSSGSQVVARSKREHTTQTRNDLIDKQMLQQNNNEDAESGILSQDGSNYDEMKRRNSYDTDSTGIDVDDKATTSEASDEHRKPRWHPPWQLKQEILAHKDSVPVLAVEPRNRWFASGSIDKSMKIWDINSGNCRLTVKAHKAGIRALAFGSTGHRFIFSAADDRQLLCTDIEVNRVVHKYPDQSSVIYAMAMYRQADLLVTCGRDKYVKIWDTRERKCVKTMRGHMNTVSSLAIIENSGQIVSGSHDSTMRIWDIGEGRCTQILTGHEKSVRSIVVHPEEPIISSASTERILHWSMPDGERVKEIPATDISINCISVNPQGALVAAGSNGVIHLWDWKSGHKFQKIHRTRVYESQEVPICVFSVAFDRSGSRLFVSDASNVIKVYGEAYTRVRRRFNVGEEKQPSRKDKKFSKHSTPETAFT